MKLFKSSIFIILFYVHSILHSAITVTANVTVGQIVDGYVNGSNTISFTATFTDADATTYNGGYIKLYISWNENGTPPEDPTDVIGDLVTISNGSATASLTAHELSLSRDNENNDHFDIKVKYKKGATSATQNIDSPNWGNVDNGEDYLTLERTMYYLNINVLQAGDTWSNRDDDDERFSSQQIQIQSSQTLSNHGGTYKNYIYFTDTENNKYRYYLGGVNADELDGSQQVINLRQRVEKYDGTGSLELDENWEEHNSAESPQDLFQNDREYDIYYTIYDVSGNKFLFTPEGSCHDCLENRVFDTSSPSVVINGFGDTGLYFGPGANPITNVDNPGEAPMAYYYKYDEDITIYIKFSEEMYRSSVEASDIRVGNNLGNLVAWTNTLTRNNDLYSGSELWSITLSDVATNYIDPDDSRTRISISENLIQDVAGNGNSAASFIFKFDIVQPTLAISAQRVDDSNNILGALSQSGKYKFTDDLLFTFTWTEANPWANDADPHPNPFINNDIVKRGFVAGRNGTFTTVNDLTYTLRFEQAHLEEAGQMISLTVPTGSIVDSASNEGPALEQLFSFYFDQTAPGTTRGAENGGVWQENNISVKATSDGYVGNAAYITQDMHHGGLNDGNAETYEITFDWNGATTGDEPLPLVFLNTNVNIAGAQSNTQRGDIQVPYINFDSNNYELYGIYNTNSNIYYESSAALSWSAHKTQAANQGTGAHLAVITDVQENAFVSHMRRHEGIDLWLGTDFLTGAWKYTPVTQEEIDADEGAPIGYSRLDGADDGTNPYVYIIQDGSWDGADAAATKKSILEVESTEINKFTIPLSSLEQGLVNISIASLSDAAGNTTNTEVISFTYDTEGPTYNAAQLLVYDEGLQAYARVAHTNVQKPKIKIKVRDLYSTAAENIEMYISLGTDFSVVDHMVEMQNINSGTRFYSIKDSLTSSHDTDGNEIDPSTDSTMFIGYHNNDDLDGVSDVFPEHVQPYSLHIKFKDLAGNETIIETADNPKFYVDLTAPTLNVSAIKGTSRDLITNGSSINGNNGNADSVKIIFTWGDLLAARDNLLISDINTSTTNGDVTLHAVPLRNEQNVNDNSEVDTLVITEIESNNNISITLAQNSIIDNAGNVGPASAGSFSFKYDIDPPILDSISVSDENSSETRNYADEGYYKGYGAANDQAEDLTVVFDWSITNGEYDTLDAFNSSDITVSVGGDTIAADQLNDIVLDAANNKYTLTIDKSNFQDPDDDNKLIEGLVRITALTSEITDAAGNVSTASGDVNEFRFTYDRTSPVPTITSVDIDSPSMRTRDTTVVLTFTWDTPLDTTLSRAFDNNDIQLRTGGGNFESILADPITTTDDQVFQLTLSDLDHGNDNNGISYVIRLIQNSATDLAGNAGPFEETDYSFIVERASPDINTITASGVTSSTVILDKDHYIGNNGDAEDVELVFTWTEGLISFTLENDINIYNDQTRPFTANNPLSGAGLGNYTIAHDNGTVEYTITVDSAAFDELNNGEIEIEVPGRVVSDSAGNVGPSSTKFFRFIYDTTRTQLEETAAVSPTVTNSGTPTVSIRAQDAYSNGSDAIEMRVYLWDETSSYWNDGELTPLRLSEDNPINLHEFILIDGGSTPSTIQLGRAAPNTNMLDGIYNNVVISVVDSAGNNNRMLLSSFTLDKTAPITPTEPISVNTYVNPFNNVYYWNGDSTVLHVTVPLPSDSSMFGGSIQLKIKIDGSEVIQNLGSEVSITSSPVANVHYLDNVNDNDVWDIDEPLTSVNIPIDSATVNALTDESDEFYLYAVITDRAGNPNASTDNEIEGFKFVSSNGVDKIIVDQTRPTAADFGSITIGDIGVPEDINIYSRATNGYWNISTQSININFSLDNIENDPSLINGYVTFEGQIDNVRDTLGYTYPDQSLDSDYKISSDDLEEEGMTINFPDYLPYEETNPEPYRNIAGIRELFNFAHEKVIFFWITITDCAGNKFVHQLNTASLIVDLVPPEIQKITSTSPNNWYMEDDIINIQIQSPSADIIVDPTTIISLNTGSISGIATLSGDGLAARNHDFTYVVSTGHTSASNRDASDNVDGLLEVNDFPQKVSKTDNLTADAVAFWITEITDVAGNFMPLDLAKLDDVGLNLLTDNVPLANEDDSLDDLKSIRVDAVAPGSFDLFTETPFQAMGCDACGIRRKVSDNTLWTYDDGIYWNSSHTSLDITVTLPEIDNAIDASLAIENVSQGYIQLKATLVDNPQDDSDFSLLGDAVDIIYDSLHTASSIQKISIDKNTLETFDPGGLPDGSIIRINAVISDIAGNQRVGTIVTGQLRTITVDYTPPDISNIESNISVAISAENNQNIVSGYWNSHSTDFTVSIPLPTSSDISMQNGRIDLRGKVSDNSNWDTLGVIGSDGYYIQNFVEGDVLTLPQIPDLIDNILYTGVEEVDSLEHGDSLEIGAILYDQAGNWVRYSNASNANIVVDIIPPTILSINSENCECAFSESDTIIIFVEASDVLVEDTDVENTSINLNSYILENEAIYSHDNDNTIFFSYVVGDQHSTENLDPPEYLNNVALQLDQVYSFRDVAGNNLDTDLTNTSDLATNKKIIIDTDPAGARFGYFESTVNPADTTDGIVSVNDSLLIIRAFFTDSIKIDSIPKIEIHFPASSLTSSDTIIDNMDRINSYEYFYAAPIINDETIDDTISIYQINGYDKGGNPISNALFIDNHKIRLDNVKPVFDELNPIDSSYINNNLISYRINETVDTGSVHWERIGGTDDPNSPYLISLDASELQGNPNSYSDISLVNGSPNLVEGAIYSISWSATDTAGNISNNSYISRYITYDTTSATAELQYSRYIVSAGYLLTITATFSEPIKRGDNPPSLSIIYDAGVDYYNVIDTLLIQDMNIPDSTVWYIQTIIPSSQLISGTATVSLSANDRAGNELNIEDISYTDTLFVDNKFPSCRLEYLNVSQNWLSNYAQSIRMEGKGGDLIQITGNFNKPINISVPLLDIQFADSTNSSFVGKLPDSNSNGDSTYIWSFVLPSNLEDHGEINILIDAVDSAFTSLSEDSTIEKDQKPFFLDNTPPDFVETGRVNSAGYNNNPSWINAYTEDIEVIGNVPVDSSLLNNRRGGIDFQMMNKNRGIRGWVTISKMNSLYGDSLQVFGSQKFSRTWDEITNESDSTDGFRPGIDIVHGDTLMFRFKVSDRVGNSTFYDTSTTLLYYDPIPPQVIVLTSGNMVTSTELVSTDVITAGWSGSLDSTYQGFEGSGIYEYRYKVMEYDIVAPDDTNTTKIVDWVSTGIDVSMDTTISLMPGNLYQLFVTAVDIAGNELDTTSVRSEILERINTPPVIGPFTIRTAWEDSLYTGMATATDVDSLTIRGDSLNYFIEWDTLTIFVNGNPVPPIEEIDYPLGATMSIDNVTGIITWIPAPPDTGIYDIRLIVKDAWNLSDTLIYPLTIYPVNDRPYFRSGDAWDEKYNLPDLPLPDTSFFEDHDGLFSINLTKYIIDEDNDDRTDISWQAVIEDTISHPGYPRISLVFGPGTPQFVRENLYEKYFGQSESKSMFGEEDIIQRQIPDNFERILKQSITLELVQDSSMRTFANFDSDSNYWAEDIKVTFMATDIEAAYAVDSILLDVVEVNDRPTWSLISNQEIYENDTVQFDLAQYITDVDDTLLTFNSVILASWELINGNWVVDTDGDNLSIFPAEYLSTGLGDTLTIIPNQLWSGYAFIEIIAADEKNARDTISFRMDVRHVPRPHLTINMVQNNAFTHYFDVIITDTLKKAVYVILDIENKRVALDTIDEYTYVGHTKFKDPGSYKIDVYANAVIGDTTVFRSVGLALARTLGRWSGASSDGRFHVDGEAGAVSVDQSIMLVDSTMFKKGFVGSYKLGDEVQEFNDPVKVSLRNYQEDQAIYQRNSDDSWTELPSYYDQGRIVAYTDKMGYFRLGRKTLVVPGLTSLGQNYPNPFNPVTKITYDVGFIDGPQQHVTLSIYNLLGQHVQTLVDAEQTIGQHAVQWYGRDKAGMNVASGVYFMHMITSVGKIQTKKVMLLR